MFSLPQGSHSPRDLPVIRISESAENLEIILGWVCPVKERPTVDSLDEAIELFAIAEKLELQCAMQPIRAALVNFLEKEPNPVRAWAFAIRYDVDDARKAAARRFVYRPSIAELPRTVELGSIDALRYYDLVQLRQTCRDRVRGMLRGNCGDVRRVALGWGQGMPHGETSIFKKLNLWMF